MSLSFVVQLIFLFLFILPLLPGISVAACHTNSVTTQPGLYQPDHLERKHGNDWSAAGCA